MKKSNPDVIIAKMDMTTNQLPTSSSANVTVQGYPTIYYFKKGSNTGGKATSFEYNGSRDVQSLTYFVHAVSKI